VANNRNVNGEVYGFVRYAKVCDVDKMLKVLNNVCFGQYHVRVVLARFDRKGEGVREGEGVGGKMAENEVVVRERRGKREKKVS